MPYSNKLKIILQSNYLYLFLILFCIFYIFIFISIKEYHSLYKKDTTTITGKVIGFSKNKDKLSLTIKGKEKIIVNYYGKEEIDTTNILGSIITASGQLKEPINNTIPNTFNYKKYLYYKKIHYTFTAKKIVVEESNHHLYKLKSYLYNRAVVNDDLVTNYLNLFILGNKSYFDSDTYSMYTENGVSHLFAISGMHISFLFLILNKLLKKVRRKHLLIMLFFWLYAFIVSFSASILRAVLFLTINYLVDYFDINISNKKKLLLCAFILIIINPFMIYDVGFIYSFIITFFIFHYSKFIKGKYIEASIRLSLVTTLASLPITALLNYEINLFCIINNLIFIPLVVFLIYPLSLLTYIIPLFASVFKISLIILEKLNLFFNNIDIFTINIPKLSIILGLSYFLILYFSVNKNKRFIYLVIIILFNKVIYKLDSNYYVTYFDVGQGDSTIVLSPHKREIVMIDTGGLVNSTYHVSDNVIKYLKSIGVTSIDLLIITHGDADHAGDALNIMSKLKVKNIFLNNNNLNNIENNINKYGHVISSYQFKYLEIKNYIDNIDNDENESSIITSLKINNYNFLFMGDAGIKREKDLLSKYNLEYTDFLKIGHHGSDTSSSEIFINKIKPKYCLISVGKNNRYGHPKDSVLETLKDCNVYRTDLNGSIEIKINKNGYKIKTYHP